MEDQIAAADELAQCEHCEVLGQFIADYGRLREALRSE